MPCPRPELGPAPLVEALAEPLRESIRVVEDYREPGKVPAGKKGMLWTITGVGVLTAVLLWAYDRMLPAKPNQVTRA